MWLQCTFLLSLLLKILLDEFMQGFRTVVNLYYKLRILMGMYKKDVWAN